MPKRVHRDDARSRGSSIPRLRDPPRKGEGSRRLRLANVLTPRRILRYTPAMPEPFLDRDLRVTPIDAFIDPVAAGRPRDHHARPWRPCAFAGTARCWRRPTPSRS